MADINRNLLKMLDGPAPQWIKDGNPVPMGNENPLPVADHVMTDGGIWLPQKGSDDGAAYTQVTGSNVEEDLFEGLIYDGIISENEYINVPKFAKGFVFWGRVKERTGEYIDNKGLRIKLTQQIALISAISNQPMTELNVYDKEFFALYFYPGINVEKFEEVPNLSVVKYSSLPVFGRLNFRLYMDGNNNIGNGEGYDLEAKLRWLS